MSHWTVLAIERLGAPDPSWPTIYGPAQGTDPVNDNNLHTLDLTPYLEPLDAFSQQMERDLTQAAFASIQLDLVDADGTLADRLGPFSTTLAAASRYFGPWIQVWEHWGTSSSALRFLGYLDETSLQWSEKDARAQGTALHASQLLRERLITDYPARLRPWPSVPTGAQDGYDQGTADSVLQDEVAEYTPRANAATLEAALWAQGQLSWYAAASRTEIYRVIYSPDGGTDTHGYRVYDHEPPAPLATSIIIEGHTYAVSRTAWDTSISAEVTYGDIEMDGTVTTYRPVRIYLQGSPNLSSVLHLADHVDWAIPEAQRTHYTLNTGAIVGPTDGSDGPTSFRLNTVDQLAPGDVLTLTFTDSTSGKPRRSTADLPPIIDLDGETGTVHVAEPIGQSYYWVNKVRRDSQDPVLFDGIAYAQALIAPFTLSLEGFTPSQTGGPVFSWLPYDVATPSLYGVFNLQTVAPAGTLRLSRRGSSPGVWSGSWASTWSWLGAPAASSTHEIYGNPLQWPGSAAPYAAPVIYLEGDLSNGATIPPNGWRPYWRSQHVPNILSQDPQSIWNGSAVVWEPTITRSVDIPSLLVAYVASTPTPGKYARQSDGTWSFWPHTAAETLGTASTPTLTGTPPTGNWIALSMGIRANGDEQEALLGLVVTGATFPFSAVSAVLLSQANGGDLTVRQSQSLWTSGGAISAGSWALGGGLVVQTYQETIDGLDYPRTRLHKLNGSTVTTADFKTLEIIPQTLVPLLLTGTAGSRKIGGWYALALETYSGQQYAAARRLRFLHLDANLHLLNGDLEADPSTPLDTATYFLRGDVVSSAVAPGALPAVMTRTSSTKNEMAGLIGGRLFAVSETLPSTVEHLRLGASIPQGNILSVEHSGDGLSVYEYLDAFATAQMASAVPLPDGNISLVSRSSGTLRTRTVGSSQATSVQATERGNRTQSQVFNGYLRKIRVTYEDALIRESATVEVTGSFDGGKILELDLGNVVSSATMARAIGQAAIYWFGQPAPMLAETWVDRTLGLQDSQSPTWWATWNVGDLVTYDLYNPSAPTPVTAWKILRLRPNPETRSVAVELRRQPFSITPEAECM